VPKVLKISIYATAIVLIAVFIWKYGPSEGSRNLPVAATQAPPQTNSAPINPEQAKNTGTTSSENITNLATDSDQPPPNVDAGKALSNRQPQPNQAGARPFVPELSDDALDKNWYKTHGFPDLGDVIRFNKMNPLELEQLAKSGDVNAMSAYGGVLMNRPATAAEGEAMLFEAAARGSIFALQELATRLGPTFPGGTIERQIAYRQVALSLGDISVVQFLAQDVRRASPEQYAMAQFLFADTMARLAALRMQLTGQGLVPNLRPLTNQRRKKEINYVKSCSIEVLVFTNVATACEMRDGSPHGNPVAPLDGSLGFDSYSDAMAVAAGLYGGERQQANWQPDKK